MVAVFCDLDAETTVLSAIFDDLHERTSDKD